MMSFSDKEIKTWTDDLIDDEFTAVSSHNILSFESDDSKLLQKHFSLLSQNNHYVYGVLTGFNCDKANEKHCHKLFNHVFSYLPLELIEKINSINDQHDNHYENIFSETFQITEQTIRENLNDVLSEKTALEMSLNGNDPIGTYYPKMKDKLNDLSQKLSLGFSCVITVINNKKIYVANIGDTRAILCMKKQNNSIRFEELSIRHDLSNQNEMKRLENISINTEKLKTNQRIGNMSLTRCLGNLKLKDFYKDFPDLSNAKTDPILSTPSFTSTDINESTLFLILASASLFQALQEGSSSINEEDAINELLLMIHDQLSKTNDLKSVPDKVINDIIQRQQNKCNLILTEGHSKPILLIRTFLNNRNIVTLHENKTFLAVEQNNMTQKNDEVNKIKNTDINESKVEDEVAPFVDFTSLIKALETEYLDYDSF